MTTSEPQGQSSPNWAQNTKLIVGLTFIAILAILLQQFNEIVGPLILAFVLAFLIQPIARWLNIKARLSWRFAVGLVFIVLAIVLAGLFTLAGFATVQQIQNLITTISRFIAQLPQVISDLTSRQFSVGPFNFDLSAFDLTAITNQLLSSAQTFLGQVGGLVGSLFTGTLTTLGRVIFTLLIAYFLLVEGGQVRENLVYINVPRYEYDIRRLGRELTRIWEAYLRSQVAIILLVIVVYYLLLTILGMRFTLGLAILAGMARFIPYIGPFIVWGTAALLAFFGPQNYFHLQPWAYTLLVIGLCILVDQVFDQYVQPRFMGSSLGVHPAAILVAAIIAFQWLGIIGLVLAAPVLATVTLFIRFAIRKMFDLDPWPTPEGNGNYKTPPDRLLHRMRAWWRLQNRR